MVLYPAGVSNVQSVCLACSIGLEASQSRTSARSFIRATKPRSILTGAHRKLRQFATIQSFCLHRLSSGLSCTSLVDLPTMTEIEGVCYCGHTTYTVHNPQDNIKVSAYCHCSRCQRLNGAPCIWVRLCCGGYPNRALGTITVDFADI